MNFTLLIFLTVISFFVSNSKAFGQVYTNNSWIIYNYAKKGNQSGKLYSKSKSLFADLSELKKFNDNINIPYKLQQRILPTERNLYFKLITYSDNKDKSADLSFKSFHSAKPNLISKGFTKKLHPFYKYFNLLNRLSKTDIKIGNKRRFCSENPKGICDTMIKCPISLQLPSQNSKCRTTLTKIHLVCCMHKLNAGSRHEQQNRLKRQTLKKKRSLQRMKKIKKTLPDIHYVNDIVSYSKLLRSPLKIISRLIANNTSLSDFRKRRMVQYTMGLDITKQPKPSTKHSQSPEIFNSGTSGLSTTIEDQIESNNIKKEQIKKISYETEHMVEDYDAKGQNEKFTDEKEHTVYLSDKTEESEEYNDEEKHVEELNEETEQTEQDNEGKNQMEKLTDGTEQMEEDYVGEEHVGKLSDTTDQIGEDSDKETHIEKLSDNTGQNETLHDETEFEMLGNDDVSKVPLQKRTTRFDPIQYWIEYYKKRDEELKKQEEEARKNASLTSTTTQATTTQMLDSWERWKLEQMKKKPFDKKKRNKEWYKFDSISWENFIKKQKKKGDRKWRDGSFERYLRRQFYKLRQLLHELEKLYSDLSSSVSITSWEIYKKIKDKKKKERKKKFPNKDKTLYEYPEDIDWSHWIKPQYPKKKLIVSGIRRKNGNLVKKNRFKNAANTRKRFNLKKIEKNVK